MSERQTCNAEHPMPTKADGKWLHPDAVEIETDYESRYGSYERYECPHCKLRFWVELAD